MSIKQDNLFYAPWPLLDSAPLNKQWGEIRSNQAALKAIVKTSVQEVETGVDELNALRALVGQAYGNLDFRNKYRFYYDGTTKEMCCQKNDGTVDTPVWTDAWCVRFTDGQFQVVSTGGIQSTAGFYGPGLVSIEEVAESGTSADTSVLRPTKIFFNADDGFGVAAISSGANRGQPEITFTQPFGKAQSFSKAGKMWQVDHNFGVSPVMVQVMDADDRVVIPDKADLSDPNTAYFYFNEVFTGSVYIASGGLGAASLVPRDPFYLVMRTDEMPASPNNTLKPNADVIFDSKFFYVNVDLDDIAGGAHKRALISLTDTVLDKGLLTILRVNDGSAAAPSITFVDDGDTGLYRVGDNKLGITAGGVQAVTVEATGHVRMNDSLSVENVVTAEAFYLTPGSGGEISKSGNDLLIKSSDGAVIIDDELSVTGKVDMWAFYVSGDGTINGNLTANLLATATPTSRSLSDRAAEVFNVKDFGAVGDGSTPDVVAIQAAIDAAGGAGGGVVFFPAGDYRTAVPLIVDSDFVTIRGSGIGSTTIRAASAMTALIRMGPASLSLTSLEYCQVSDITLHGGSTCTDAVLRGYNNHFCLYENLRITSGSSHGGFFDGDITELNTKNHVNVYRGIWTLNNGGEGLHWEGDKSSIYSDLFANNNGSHGFVWEASNFDEPSTLSELTEVVATNIIAATNTGDGIVWDGVAKFSAGNFLSHNNGGVGLRFRSTHNIAASTSAGGNLFSSIATLVLRNNVGGGIGTDDNAYVSACQFGEVQVIGSGGGTDIVGIDMKGWTQCSFGSIYMQLVNGTGILMQDGTDPNGVATFCTHNSIARATLNTNGTGSSLKHGMRLIGNTNNIHIGSIRTAGNDDGGNGYELSVEGTASNVHISNYRLNPAGSNQIQLTTSNIDSIYFNGPNIDVPVPTVASASTITIPPCERLVLISGNTTVSSIAASWKGRIVTLAFNSALTFRKGSGMFMSETFSPTADSTISFVCKGSEWYEVSSLPDNVRHEGIVIAEAFYVQSGGDISSNDGDLIIKASSGEVVIEDALRVKSSGITFKNEVDTALNLFVDSGSSSTQTAALLFRDKGFSKWRLGKSSANVFFLNDQVNGNDTVEIFPHADNANALTVRTGRVGIGIQDPLQKLHVAGNALVNGDLAVGDKVVAEAFYLTTGGEVTAFSGAMVSKDSNQSIPNNTEADLTWETVNYDTDNWFGSSGDTFFTVPVGVRYVRITCHSSWDTDADGYRQLALEKSIDGGAFTVVYPGASVMRTVPPPGIEDSAALVSNVLPTNSGDRWQIQVKHTAGAPLNYRTSVGVSFSIQAVG